MSSQWFLEYFEKSMLEKIIEKNPKYFKEKKMGQSYEKQIYIKKINKNIDVVKMHENKFLRHFVLN